MIDDRLPGKMIGTTFHPRYMKRGKNKGWWGPILEKAGAKYWGHYRRMHAGLSIEAFDMFLGMPAQHQYTKPLDTNKIWSLI
jgi:hypothetical protein